MKPAPNAGDPVQKKAAGPSTGTIADLNQLPAVAAYLHRVGAEPKNFKSATITETRNDYPFVSGRITFSPDGKVEVSDGVQPPNDEERAAIIAAFEGAHFPKPVTLAAIGDGPPGCDLDDPNTFICHDFNGQVVMVHQRYHTRDGDKGFIPWTRWSDGQWRKMEPDVMPFYGLPGAKEHGTLYIHEGAKAAFRTRRMYDGDSLADREARKRFPWYENMRGAHVGWIGGVYAVERSDWQSLVKMGWKRVVVVADNDGKGLRAARRIAKKFRCEVFILAFDKRFDEGFDLGDEFPPSLFSPLGHYTGPTFRNCLLPATQATDLIPSTRRGGPPTAVVREEFAASVAFTVDPQRFVSRHNPSADMSAEEFNAQFAAFSDVKDLATKVLGEIECMHHKMIWDPSKPPGTVVQDDGFRSLNVYDPPRIVPVKGDVTPWIALLDHLLPDGLDRAHFMRFLATLFAKPDTKMKWAVLLISQMQGVGKGSIGAACRAALGKNNVSFPSNKSIAESQFNGWAVRKRLAFVPELYSGHSKKAANDLKAMITDETIDVNQKHLKGYDLDNWLHIIACSNSERALHIENDDRRWFIPKVREAKRDPLEWTTFYNWLEDVGASRLMFWAQEEVKAGRIVTKSEEAPASSRKREIATKSLAPGQKLAVEFAEHLTGLVNNQVIVRTSHLREWVASRRGFKRQDGTANIADHRLEAEDALLRAVKMVPGIVVWANQKRQKFSGVKDSLVMNFTPGEADGWADIKDRLRTADGIGLEEEM